MGKAFSLGKLFGIEFRVHFSWFVIFILLTMSLVYPYYTEWFYWVIGIVASLVLFASVVAHELAHALVGRANGIPITNITLFIFGGIAQMNREATRPGAELKMAVAGPVCSLLLGACFGLLSLIRGIPEPITILIYWLAITNGVILTAFNLVPGFPLDGGRILRSLLWWITGSYKHASQIAIRLGQSIGYLLILGGILLVFLRPFGLAWWEGIWIALVGWFLASAASASYRQLLMPEAFSASETREALTSDRPLVPLDVDSEK
jgi:Zn-dependent protease